MYSDFFSTVTRSRRWCFSTVHGVYAIIRQFDYVQSNSSQIFSEDVLWARSSTMYSGGYKNGQGTKHSQVGEERMYTDSHDTKKLLYMLLEKEKT